MESQPVKEKIRFCKHFLCNEGALRKQRAFPKVEGMWMRIAMGASTCASTDDFYFLVLSRHKCVLDCNLQPML